MPRIVIFLDNVPAHGTDLVEDIAKTLNYIFCIFTILFTRICSN